MQLLNHKLVFLKLFWRWCCFWECDIQLKPCVSMVSLFLNPSSCAPYGWGKVGGRRGPLTSSQTVFNAGQFNLGKRLTSNCALISRSSLTSSHSFGWRGKEAEDVLQVLTAQVRKLRVRIFILAVVYGSMWWTSRRDVMRGCGDVKWWWRRAGGETRLRWNFFDGRIVG